MTFPNRDLRLAKAALWLTVALLALPLVAGAALDSQRDANDTPGLLDVKRVRVGGKQRPRFQTITFAEWGANRIWDRGYNIVWIDARGDRWFEHYALVYSDGHGMQATLYRRRRDRSTYAVASLNAWKPRRDRVTVRVPLSELKVPDTRTYYRWFVKTLMTGSACPRVCIDRVPDSGAIRTVFVPEPSPTPTVSPTPTESPSPTPTGSPTETPTP